MENEVWRWLWTIAALVFGLAEVFTAGFFLLPFAIGAAAAAVLGWVDVHVLWQWLAFFVVTMVSFVYLRRWVSKQNKSFQPRVGANRLIDAQGTVIEKVDADADTGMIRLGGERWRASAGETIEVGIKVMVTEVQGTRVVVTAISPDPNPNPDSETLHNTES